MGMRHRVRVDAGGDEAGNVRHIHHQVCANSIGNLTEFGKIKCPRIGGTTGKDDLWLTGTGLIKQRVEIDQCRFLVNAILLGIEPFAGQVRRRTMGQVPAGCQRHAENRIARLQ